MATEWKGTTNADYLAFKAAPRVEQIESMLEPIRERRTQFDRAQAYVNTELERWRADPESNAAELAEREREWWALRNVEGRLNTEELVVNKAVASISSKPLLG
jgi:hypothetical protein